MSQIHSTAVIDPHAEIGENCTIGAYCVIGPNVKIGANNELRSHVSVAGPTTIGEGNLFYPYSSIGERTQDLKYEREPTYLTIGDGNTFREFCTINRASEPEGFTTIGNNNNFLAYSHVAHDCRIGNHVIFSNNGTVAGHVEVEDYVVIGGLSGVHQFCRIGQHSIIGGCTKIVQDVPPFMIADGNPAKVRSVNQVGLERKGVTADRIRLLREAYRLIYRSQINVKQAVERIRTELENSAEIQDLIAFISTSERGIVR